MTHLVILVDFRIKLETHQMFCRLIKENSATSLRHEPGCKRFDVLSLENGPKDRVILYEIYANAEAFDAHLRSDHYRAFELASMPMVLEKTAMRLCFVDSV